MLFRSHVFLTFTPAYQQAGFAYTLFIVRNLSRIGRDTIRTINWIKDIENQGVSVVIRDIPAELLETICTEVIT